MTAETSNARGKVKVGDRVRATRDGSLFYRHGDCGTVIRIDRDGDFWVRWDNPIVPDSGHGWCISPHHCALVAKQPAAFNTAAAPVHTQCSVEQQPVSAGEEIMVSTPNGVFILTLQPSGLDGEAPRFVVHVPETKPAAVDDQDAQVAEVEALRAEVEKLRADRDSWEQQASDRVADWYAEHLRAERLAEALREWWSAHRPVGWTEDQHRARPYVNLITVTDKALTEALLRDQEDRND